MADGTTYVGSSCFRGHPGERRTSNGSCVECSRAYNEARRQTRVLTGLQRAHRVYRTKEAARLAAKVAGETQYTSERVCSRGHVNLRRSTSTGACVKCHAMKVLAAYRRGLPTPTRPEPEVCDNCRRPPRAKALAIDHDHKTGAFRGWLCGPCNTGIGLLGDTEESVQQTLAYLHRSKQ